MNRLLAIAYILFCIEVGAFLMYIPWSGTWDSNQLLDYVTVLRPLILHIFFRAGVTILGAIDIFIGLVELRYFLRSFKIANHTSL
jgi:hypothetical protein